VTARNFFPRPSSHLRAPTYRRTPHPMTTAQVTCFGCNRKFAPRGLSQHVSKSRDPRCRASSVTRQGLVSASGSSPCTTFPQALDPNSASQGLGNVAPDDLGMRDYSLDVRDDEMDEHDGMPSPGSGRVSPNGLDVDSAMRGHDLDKSDDEMDGCDGTQLPDGEFKFAATRITVLDSSESYIFTDIDAVDPEEDPSGSTDPADVMDADAFEALTQRNHHPRTTIPNQRAVDTTAELSNIPIEEPIPFNVPDAEMLPTVVIDRFPLGNAGTQIPGIARGSNDDMAAAQSVWAPFVSQCDWQVAHWAKMRGSTSSAMTDLLAIGEVRIPSI